MPKSDEIVVEVHIPLTEMPRLVASGILLNLDADGDGGRETDNRIVLKLIHLLLSTPNP